MLTLKNLSLTAADAQGRADIVKNVSLDVEDGKFLVITGPNGGGKTTLAKLIMGLAAPTGGQILLDGEDITGLSITDRARRGISYSFQQPPRFKGMKVSDLLTIAAGKPLRRRGQAHRDCDAAGQKLPDYDFRRARGGHRSVVVCQADGDVPRTS